MDIPKYTKKVRTAKNLKTTAFTYAFGYIWLRVYLVTFGYVCIWLQWTANIWLHFVHTLLVELPLVK